MTLTQKIKKLEKFIEDIAENPPEGEWYLLPPSVHGVIGYITDPVLGEVAYKGKPMNMKEVIREIGRQAVKILKN